ncbi:hypothetical protein BG015_005224 [Linnemannia schmuckeri]|uniref:F-box domain-containing protein n=1 Tax=Linnemannia schmuckeri TaxID=64567 RepID=A0A9P5VC58_9FUNG|nr:hypothetical protein BG015_005224 [Linnemannia schmuckeri]
MAGITDLPKEVLVDIGNLLDRHTLITSLLTCRYFHQSLFHLLLRTTRVKEGKPQVSVNELTRYAHNVHHFEIHGVVPWDYYKIAFPCLRTMAIHRNTAAQTVQDNVLMEEQDRHCIILFRLNPTVQDLELYSIGNAPCANFWEAIFTSFRRPRRLDVNRIWELHGHRLNWFWQACSRFEELNFTEFSGDSPSILSELNFESIKRVSMNWQKSYGRPCIEYDGQLEILQKFSNLTRMHWTTHGGAFPREAFLRALEDSAWPRLEDLGFTGMMGKDTRNRGIIDKLPPLRRVQFDIKQFGESCWSSFKPKQRNSLRALDLRGCYSFKKCWALDVFSHFGQLEEFSICSIEVADVKLYPHALSSFGLKRLDAFFINDTKDTDGDHAVFEMLSNFDMLESIYVRDEEHQVFSLEEAKTFKHPHTLRWRLDVGLGKLWKLKNLRRLVLDNRFQDMRVEDLEWMLEQWPLLSELTGWLSEDPLVRAKLAGLLRARGVLNRDFDGI